MTTRDVQRAKVYKAEGRAWKLTRYVIHDRAQFPDLAAVEAYVVKVCSSKRVRARYARAEMIATNPKRRLELHDGGGSRRGRGGWSRIRGQGRLQLPLFCRNEPMILHELAHVLTHDPALPGHGWEFCEAYLYLVLIVLGREDHDRLKAEFKAGRVRISKPRAKRELTPEQKAVLLERLAAGRAKTPAVENETLAFWGLS